RETTCDPKYRKVLVTDAKTALGQALVKSLVEAGADLVWAGHAEPWKKFAGFDELKKLLQDALVPLDVTDPKIGCELAAEIGARARGAPGAQAGRRGPLPRRPGAGMAGAVARQSQGPGTRDIYMKVLTELASALAASQIRVVDLTHTLTPEFPQITLPPELGQ